MTTYTTIPSNAVIERAARSLRERTNVEAVVVESKAQALKLLLAKLTEGAEIYNNASATLQEIGFTDYLAEHPHRFKNVRHVIVGEPEAGRRYELRRRHSAVDYVVGSVNALTERGEMLFASHGGSQVPMYAFTAKHAIWVVGANKIVPTLEEAFRRVREYAHPLEDKRIGRTDPPTRIGKWLIYEYEWYDNRASVILVKEALGF
jgi:L-lactate utilization protein LutC